jgi:hypothetical protein
MNDLAVHLDYAPPPRGLARRRVRRRVALVLGLLLAACFARPAYRTAQGTCRDFARQADYVRRFDAVAHYAPPPDRIVASDQPADVTALAATASYHKDDWKPPILYSNGESRLAGLPPHPVVLFVPPFQSSRLMFLMGPQTIAFAHARQSPSRHEDRVVYVWVGHRATMQRYPEDRKLTLEAYVLPRPGYWPYARSPGIPAQRFALQLPPTSRARVYAGQPDPADPARFSIRYVLDDQPGVITASLDDADQLTFAHSGPAQPAAPEP